MTQQPVIPPIIPARFDDLRTLSRTAGWDLDFRQLSFGKTEIDLKILANANISMMKIAFNQGIHQRGITPTGMLTFGIPLGGMRNWFGVSTEKAAMMNFNHRCGYDSVSSPGHQAYTISLSEDYITSTAEELGLSVPDYIYRPPAGSVFEHSQTVSQLKKLLPSLLDDQHLILDAEMETQLVAALLNVAMESSGHGDSIPLPARSRAISSAIEFVEDYRYESVTVRDICKNTNVSIRTLDRAFKERFDVTPKTYIKNRRLAGVNNALLAADASQLVSDIANEWGFWHMGQFAKDYRALFGELPSITLRRHRDHR